MSRLRHLRIWFAGFALSLAAPAFAEAPEATLAELRSRAEAGEAESQNELGDRLLATNDEAKFLEAREWFRRSFEGGSVEGMNNYAVTLKMGIGGPADENEGRRLQELAASRGSIGANLSIAERYAAGDDGYSHDPKRALEHTRTAAESPLKGANYAQWKLGMMYLQGIGTPADAAEAYRWVARAADNDAVAGMISRAVMLATGEGIAENDVEARAWYKRAAESGEVMFAQALRGLGAMLVTGEGGPTDLPRGIAYLRVAAAADDEQASALLKRFDDQVTPEVDRQAQEIANRWVREYLPDAA